MIDIVEILIHWYAGRSQNELADELGVDRKTLRKYTGPGAGGGDRAGRAADGRGGLARRWRPAGFPGWSTPGCGR